MKKLVLIAMGAVALMASASFSTHCHLRFIPSLCNDARSGECYWNYADGLCEYRSNAPRRCLQMDIIDCFNNNDVCFWNNATDQCVGRYYY